MIKLLKAVFKVMIFIAKATWFCLIFVILYALVRDYVGDLIKTHNKKKASQEMGEEILSDENLNKDPHERKEPEDA